MRWWQELAEPYRAEAWSECARLVRARVDEDPFDLSMRALLASLLLRSRQGALALMQYERLLPLAVGQGELFRALATQRRLDELHPPSHRHPDRYRAIQDWFRALTGVGTLDAEQAGPAFREDVTPLGALLALPPEAFTGLVERSKVVPLDPGPQTIDDSTGIVWVVFFGGVRGAIVRDPGGAREPFAAGEGDLIRLPEGDPAARRLEIEVDTPCEVIQFDPALADFLDGKSDAPEPAAMNRLPDPAPVPPRTVDPNAPRLPLPRPDPLAEPTVAAGSLRDRRRETRMAVILETRVALLSEESGPPLHGTVADVSTGGIGLRFPAGQLRQAPGVHPEAAVSLQIRLRDSDEVLQVAGRVAWIEWHPVAPGGGTESARVGIEFGALSALDRERLVRLLDAAERSQN